MREILFRGKRLDDGGWSIGDLLQYRSGETVIHSYVNGCRVADDIDPTTIGQYTGLKDKNGKRIFEGDLLRSKGKRIFYVEYNPDIATFVTRATDAELSTPCMNYGTMLHYEVIGNIHDNPELCYGFTAERR